MSGAASRLAAAEVLTRIITQRRTLDESLVQTPSFNALTGSDRGFARAIVSATLRQFGRLTLGLDPFLKRSLASADPIVQSLLLTGAAQLWLLGTPTHAAVGETVSAAKLSQEARKAAGFLNAVLRKASRNQATFEDTPVLGVWPDWLAKTAAQTLGPKSAEALAHAQTIEPDLHLTVKPGNLDTVIAAFMEAGLAVDRLSGSSLSVPSGPVSSYPLYGEGCWWVQDIAAALPAQLLTGGPDRTFLDLCAAPGGKTMQLASTGARVLAVDRSAKRLERVAENLARTKLTDNTELVAEDATSWRPAIRENIDGVLVDAPCSALGTLRRHPEGAWIKKENDISSYPTVQKKLLTAALNLVRPGGQVVYCVCSPFPAEGSAVVEAALETGNFARIPIKGDEVSLFKDCITPSGDVLTLPSDVRPAHDAFFIARLTKTS